MAYSTSYDIYERVDELVSWFSKFDLDFGVMYSDEPDKTGHAFGPESNQYKNKVKNKTLHSC